MRNNNGKLHKLIQEKITGTFSNVWFIVVLLVLLVLLKKSGLFLSIFDYLRVP